MLGRTWHAPAFSSRIILVGLLVFRSSTLEYTGGRLRSLPNMRGITLVRTLVEHNAAASRAFYRL
jgi:hypothetical protein